MQDISYLELIHCNDYAEKVIDYYKLGNNGELPYSRNNAEQCLEEYDTSQHSFQSLYGYNIDDYIDVIIETIGYMVSIEC